MKNIEIHINCVLIDLNDVQVQINTILNQILFALALNDASPSSSVSYNKDGLVITLSDLDNFMESSEVIINILEDHRWLASVVKIELIDFSSDQKMTLIPRITLTKVQDPLVDEVIAVNNQQLSNCINFN